MSKEQRRETSRNRFTVGRAKSSLIGGIAAFAFMASAEGCQESDKTTLPEPSPVSTRFAPEPPKITFDSQEAKKKAELEAFNRKITSVVNYMSQSDIPELSSTAAKWEKLSSEGKLYIIPLQEWEDGAKIALTSREDNLIDLIGINKKVLFDEKLTVESAAVFIYALDRHVALLSGELNSFKAEGTPIDTAIKMMASDSNFNSINEKISARAWKEAMETTYFRQNLKERESVVGKVADSYQFCKETPDFDRCWSNGFSVPKRPTASDINQGNGQLRSIPNNSHVARS